MGIRAPFQSSTIAFTGATTVVGTGVCFAAADVFIAAADVFIAASWSWTVLIYPAFSWILVYSYGLSCRRGL